MKNRDNDPGYAYFYPLTTKCKERERRANAHGAALLPKVTHDGRLDMCLLEAIRENGSGQDV